MTMVRWLFRVLVGFAVAIGLLFVVARFHDGPLGPIPGGALVAGELVTQPVTDWSFVKDVPEIELQLVSQNRSRTVWILEQGGEAFIPCSTSFPPGKTWYRLAAQDGRAILRIQGRRYPVMLTRKEDPALGGLLRQEVLRKYKNVPPGESEAWVFLISSRPADK
jgi:hypothetical protein